MTPPSSHALTPRERQVAAAVTRGLSNRLIGKELGISAETVKRHLASIYTKLHVPGRVALAVHVLQEPGWLLDGAGIDLRRAHGVDQGEAKTPSLLIRPDEDHEPSEH